MMIAWRLQFQYSGVLVPTPTAAFPREIRCCLFQSCTLPQAPGIDKSGSRWKLDIPVLRPGTGNDDHIDFAVLEERLGCVQIFKFDQAPAVAGPGMKVVNEQTATVPL